jgi:manganese/iron transport system permease protein
MLVGPAMTAYLLVKELHVMMAVGAVLGAIASIVGMYLSFYLDVPSGAAIVLVVFGTFFLAFLFSPSQGLLTQHGSRWRSLRLLQGIGRLRDR